MDLMDDEPFCAELMDLCVEVGIEFARAQVDAGADTIGIGDAIASQVSPATYERLIQPRERRLIEAVHAAGARVRLHICGDTTHLLPGIAGLGADIVDVDHMVDMAGARRVLGAGVTLAGNIDPAAVLRSRSPQAIREAMAAHLRRSRQPLHGHRRLRDTERHAAREPASALRADLVPAVACYPARFVRGRAAP